MSATTGICYILCMNSKPAIILFLLATAVGAQEPASKASPTAISVATSKDKPIDVRSDVTKDWMDKANWFFAAALVMIGGLGVYAAVRTLNQIKRQADLMQQQTTEARETSASKCGTFRLLLLKQREHPGRWKVLRNPWR
jgi:hypothetical protein